MAKIERDPFKYIKVSFRKGELSFDDPKDKKVKIVFWKQGASSATASKKEQLKKSHKEAIWWKFSSDSKEVSFMITWTEQSPFRSVQPILAKKEIIGQDNTKVAGLYKYSVFAIDDVTGKIVDWIDPWIDNIGWPP